MIADVNGDASSVVKPDGWAPTPDRPYRTLSDEQVDRMNRLQAWAHLRGDKPDLQDWLAEVES